jgi:uncharacterized protein with HEPN domain
MTERQGAAEALSDIAGAIAKVQRFTAGMDYDAFAADDKTTFAVVRALEVMGEAAKAVPLAVRSEFPDVPWRALAGMRDKLIHAYMHVNLVVVWKTVTEDLPLLHTSVLHAVEALRQSALEGSESDTAGTHDGKT